MDELYVSSNAARCLRQALGRKENIEMRLRKDNAKLNGQLVQANCYIKKMQTEANRMSNSQKVKKRKFKGKLTWVALLKEKEQELKRMKKKQEELERENQGLTDMIFSEKTTPKFVVKEGGQFTTKYRKAAYHCLMNQVPVETIGSIIENVVKEVTGAEVSDTPSAPTVSQMAYELGVISDLQVGESLSFEEDMTIAWDATSLRDDHVNEVHIHFKDEPPRGLSLQISTLPGATSDDYYEHITTTVRDVVTTFAGYKREDAQKLEVGVFGRIKNTITDRASVNHCVVKKT